MFTGGPGNSLETAVVIHGVGCTAIGIRAEKHYLTEQFGLGQAIAGDSNGWQMIGQAMIGPGARSYDQIMIRLADQTEQTIYFDITEFFGTVP
jgi:hypothetical protein